MSDERPEGWSSLTLAGAGSWCSGGTPSRKVAAYFGGGIPWIKSGELNDGVITDIEERITPAGLENSSARLLPQGTVTIAMYGATIGRVGIFGLDAATNQACANCQVDERLVDRWFLLYYLLSQRDEFVRAGQGGAQPNISATILKEWPFPLAPLAEQRRIVGKVEALLAQVNAARERLTKVPLILKRFRQAVLAAACSGRLTEEWRRRHPIREDGKAVVRAALRESDSRDPLECDRLEVPEAWGIGAFGSLVVNFDGRRVPVKASDRHRRRGKYPYYGASGVIDSIDGFLFDGDFLLVAEDGANLLSRSTPIAFKASGRFWVNNHAHVVQPRVGIPLEFLGLVLNSLDLQHYVTGTAQPKLTQGALNAIPVPVPPVAEQEQIVRCVRAFFSLADAIEKRVTVAASRAGKVPQAILSKAFSGELVPTEAELARAEGRDYESASVLLERIRAGHATSPSPKAPARRTRGSTSQVRRVGRRAAQR